MNYFPFVRKRGLPFILSHMSTRLPSLKLVQGAFLSCGGSVWIVSLMIFSCFSSSFCIILIYYGSLLWYCAALFLYVHGRNISTAFPCMKGNLDGPYSKICGGISW
jgi:hypothetical protein